MEKTKYPFTAIDYEEFLDDEKLLEEWPGLYLLGRIVMGSFSNVKEEQDEKVSDQNREDSRG